MFVKKKKKKRPGKRGPIMQILLLTGAYEANIINVRFSSSSFLQLSCPSISAARC